MGIAIARLAATLSALAGFCAVSLGAFGAHALGDALSAERAGWWETATFYLLVHAGTALAISVSNRADTLAPAGLLLIIGAIIFSATLYAMALGAPRWFGAITPIGGAGMLAGWAMIILQTVRSR